MGKAYLIAKTVIYDLLMTIVSGIGWILKRIPGKVDAVVFSQCSGRYNGNSRYLYEYLSDQGIKVYWLYESKAQLDKMPEKYKKHARKRLSFSGLKCVIKSNIFVISYSGFDFGLLWYIVRHRYVVSLWHAITIKDIALLDKKFTKAMSDRYLIKETRYYKAQIASSNIDRCISAAAHGIDVRKVHVTGLPKTDQYIRSMTQKRKYASKEMCFKVLYAPTFRDYNLLGSIFFPFSDFSIEKLRDYFAKFGKIKIYLRPHPGDKHSNVSAEYLATEFPENIIYYSSIICDDIDEELWLFDAVITDYSSVFVEPLLNDIPCIFVPFDYDKYIQTRGLAYDYNLVASGPQVNTFEEMWTALEDAKTGALQWAEKRKQVADIFIKYKDENSCERITKQILSFRIKNRIAATD
jgi:CDP-glycerol glycerophosphotransferase